MSRGKEASQGIVYMFTGGWVFMQMHIFPLHTFTFAQHNFILEWDNCLFRTKIFFHGIDSNQQLCITLCSSRDGILDFATDQTVTKSFFGAVVEKGFVS